MFYFQTVTELCRFFGDTTTGSVSDSGAMVVGIAIDEAEPVKNFAAEIGVNHPIAIAGDLDGTRLAQSSATTRSCCRFRYSSRLTGPSMKSGWAKKLDSRMG